MAIMQLYILFIAYIRMFNEINNSNLSIAYPPPPFHPIIIDQKYSYEK